MNAVSQEDQQDEENNSDNGEDQEKQILFIEYQTKIVELTKSIQENVKDMSLCSSNELGHNAQQLTQTFNSLIQACKGAIQNCTIKDLSQRIKICTQELGKACIDLIHLAGRVQQEQDSSQLDKILRKELLDHIDIVQKLSQNLLHSFKTSAKGTQACISANSSVNGIIADLNTVIMFATAGTLKAETDSDSFSNHRESVLRSAKTLVEDTKSLVSASGTTVIDQNELAQSVQTSVRTMVKLADAVKLGAASLGSDQPDAQVLLINSVKDVCSALSDLIATIKLVSSGGQSRQSMNLSYSASLLSESAKNMITSVQSLLKTVKTVEDEAQRGNRALESAIEAIYQEIKMYSGFLTDEGKQQIQQLQHQQAQMNPEDLIKATKQITMATSKAIGAANSLRQEDIIAAANLGRKAVSDLLFVCRSALNSNVDTDLQDCQQEVLNVGINCAVQYKDLLECIQTVSRFIRNT